MLSRPETAEEEKAPEGDSSTQAASITLGVIPDCGLLVKMLDPEQVRPCGGEEPLNSPPPPHAPYQSAR
jgi:hypothetical protein